MGKAEPNLRASLGDEGAETMESAELITNEGMKRWSSGKIVEWGCERD